MDIVKILIYLYIIFFVIAGLNHFYNPTFYDSMVPSFIPYPRIVHQFTGLLEIIIPLFLLTKWRKEAAIIMILFLIAIYGANLYVWINKLPYGKTVFTNTQHLIRFFIQVGYIWLTYVIYRYDK